MGVFFLHVYMFSKHEKSEMDDFERKQNLVLNVNTYKNFNSLRIYGVKVFNGYPCKHFKTARMQVFLACSLVLNML